VLTAWDIKQKYGKGRVCFSKVVVGIYGPASPFCLINPPTRCEHSPLFRAYSDFVIRGLNLHQMQRNDDVVVNWMSRRSSVQWPERSFCDDRFFRCERFTHLGTRNLFRVVKNDQEVVTALENFCSGEWQKGKRVRCIASDYNKLSFLQQVETDRVTDIMVGPHGAGLTHQAFLPDRAFVIELFIDGSSPNQHFHNMARWRGRTGDMYQGLIVSNPVPVEMIINSVRNAVKLMRPRQLPSHDLAILILTCNRQTSLEALLETLSHANGIRERLVYVSIDCNPGPLLNLTLWSTRGLALQLIDSQQRHVIETGEAKSRRDERVTRHWLHAVHYVLLKHEHVLYLEDDHLVHPSILHDAEVLLSAQPSMCPTCFAVQLGCHRDCWGMASTASIASDVARMEPGNMGVVYSRNMWQWFLQHLPEYCSIYGIWDVNLHHLLSVHPEHKHALTYLKARVVHNSGCGSDRNTAGHAECDDRALLQDQAALVGKNMSMTSALLDKGLANIPSMKIDNVRAIQADSETKRRCIESTEVGSMPTQKHGSTGVDSVPTQKHGSTEVDSVPTQKHGSTIADRNEQIPVFLCFCFDNELDLLHIKLEKLSHVVTKFIISESTYSARGSTKQATFSQHKNETRWKRFLPQIVHLVDQQQPPGTGVGLGWYTYTRCKNVMADYLASDPEFTSTYSDGVVVMSDMDELASADQIDWLQRKCCAEQETITIDMPYYFYGLHWKANNLGATMMTARRLKHELRFWSFSQQNRRKEFTQHIRNIPRDIKGLQDGVHCSYCGTDEENVEKLQHVNFVDGPPFLGKYYWDRRIFRALKACGVKPSGEELIDNFSGPEVSLFSDRREYFYLHQNQRQACDSLHISAEHKDNILPALLSSKRISIQWIPESIVQYTLSSGAGER
tara:strand:- start:32 stop:2737 length:2706 start_codon:yes stop_codon:yes gene_type:complete